MLKAIFGEDAEGEVPANVWPPIIGSLPVRLGKAVWLRFCQDGERLSYARIGKHFWNHQTQVWGVSRERARQLTLKALRLLRHPYRSKGLRPYIILKGG